MTSLNSLSRGDREGLIRAYDDEEAAGFGLTDLAEESGSDDGSDRANGKKTKANGKTRYDDLEAGTKADR